ncbi:MAG: Flp pilus assembly complex ATPase component TadA [Ruminococcus sp.]|nr:Flp pilus assembly complex ATPase component TadA [Ruminococcus sp.]
MYKNQSRITSIYPLLPLELRQAVMSIDKSELEEIQEIRLRRNKPIGITALGKEYFLTRSGTLSNDDANTVKVSGNVLEAVYRAALDNSIHSHASEIREGYITVGGGCRIGFCGTAVIEGGIEGRLQSVKDVNSLNIRIAREIHGCAEGIYSRFMKDGLSSLLIAGPPSSGKTTVLRDLCRIIGSSYKTAVIDERNELAAVKDGDTHCEIGLHSDVFTSYKKSDAIETAVRTMSPDVIICDEIGSKRELEAYLYALDSGVKLVATCHASSVCEARKRETVSKLIKLGAFEYMAVLGKGSLVGRVVEAAAVPRRS